MQKFHFCLRRERVVQPVTIKKEKERVGGGRGDTHLFFEPLSTKLNCCVSATDAAGMLLLTLAEYDSFS